MLYEPILLETKYDCANLSVRVDTATDGRSEANRDVVEHVDSVAVVALDDQDRGC